MATNNVHTTGVIRFPVNDPAYYNSAEGHLIVLAYVIPVTFIKSVPYVTSRKSGEVSLAGSFLHKESSEKDTKRITNNAKSLLRSPTSSTLMKMYATAQKHKRLFPNQFSFIDNLERSSRRIFNEWIAIDQGAEEIKSTAKQLCAEFSRYAAIERDTSIPCTAILTLGSTTWTGRHKGTLGLFLATERHLNAKGRTLYKLLQALYPPPNHKIEIVTFLRAK